MNISEKKAVFVLVYMIRIKHDAYSCLHVLLMIKNLDMYRYANKG